MKADGEGGDNVERQVRFAFDKRHELPARHFDRGGVVEGLGRRGVGEARQRRGLAHQVPFPHDFDDQLAAVGRFLEDLDLAVGDDVEGRGVVPFAEEDISFAELPEDAALGYAGEGTTQILKLVIGRRLTGIQAFV